MNVYIEIILFSFLVGMFLMVFVTFISVPFLEQTLVLDTAKTRQLICVQAEANVTICQVINR